MLLNLKLAVSDPSTNTLLRTSSNFARAGLVGHRRVPFGRSRPLGMSVTLRRVTLPGCGYFGLKALSPGGGLLQVSIRRYQRSFIAFATAPPAPCPPAAEIRFAPFDGRNSILPHSHPVVGRKFQSSGHSRAVFSPIPSGGISSCYFAHFCGKHTLRESDFHDADDTLDAVERVALPKRRGRGKRTTRFSRSIGIFSI